MRKVPVTISVERKQRDEVDNHPYVEHIGRSGIYRLAVGEFLKKTRQESENVGKREILKKGS